MITSVALLLVAVRPAAAADLLLSGGLSAMPSVPEVVVPSWRLGVSFGRFTPWCSAVWASIDGAADVGDLSAWGLMPRIGARLDFADRAPDVVVPFAGASLSVLVSGATIDGEVDTERTSEIPPIGMTLGGGLEAPVTEVFSVSAEVGADLHLARQEEFGDETALTGFVTYGALFLNLWL